MGVLISDGAAAASVELMIDHITPPESPLPSPDKHSPHTEHVKLTRSDHTAHLTV